MLRVGKHMCLTRGFCGRDGGFDGRTFTPFVLIGNHPGTDYLAGLNNIRVADFMSNIDDVLAHELGHLMDFNYADDRITDTRQGDEVQEALADMFAYDYDRANATLGEDLSYGPLVNWANPAPAPARMLDYRCNISDTNPHFNATILSHAYYRFVQKVGHPRAGNVLQYIPWYLSARPRFIDVQRGFAERAEDLYPPQIKVNDKTISQHAIDAFLTEVGIGRDVPTGPGC